MKKKKIVILVAVCFLIGIGIMIQAKMTDGQHLYVSRQTIQDYQSQIQGEKAALEDVKKLISQREKSLSYYNKDSAVKMQKLLKSDLEKNKIFAGTQKIKGPGVTITVDDGKKKANNDRELNDQLVHDSDILKTINELKAAGAEAISVNGQRVTNTTSVSCAGYTVRINGATYARPFIIQAIGDPTKLTDRLIGVAGYGKELQEWGIQFQIKSANRIEIAGYDDAKEFTYMKEEEE